MSKNDTHKKSFFAKYSIEHSSFLHAEGVSNLKLATGFIASFFGAFVFAGEKIKKFYGFSFLLHYLALFYVSCK
jgi:hypothetical protein